MKVVLELIFIAILVASIWGGYKKGLVMTAGSIIIIIISLFMGDLLSDTFSHEAVTALRPFVGGYMEGSVDGAIPEALAEVSGGASNTLSADDMIELRPDLKLPLCEQSYLNMGIFAAAAETMAEEAVLYHEQSSASISSSIVEIMCQKLSYYACFLLFFAVFVILLTVLGNITNLSFKIPNMNKVNTIGGIVAGVGVGFLYCSLVAWMLHFTGMLLPEDELSGLFVRLFVGFNTLSGYLSV